jgi:hypothetical protein
MNVYDLPNKPPRYLSIKRDAFPITLTIKDCVAEFARYRTAPVLEFVEISKTLILNAANTKILADTWSSETNHWIGKRVELTLTTLKVFGKNKPGIKVQPIS